jgi:2-furoate---CoA ligase
VTLGHRLSYADLLERVRRCAGALTAYGVGPGDRVCAAVRNRVESLVLYWATGWVGAVFVPLNWRLTPSEIAYCVRDADAAVFAHETDSPGAAGEIDGRVRVLDILSDGLDGTPVAEPAPVEEAAPALMLYTSGTTGPPKGVPRSHRAEWAAALAHVIQCGYRPGERTLGVMPWYHTMGIRSLLSMVVVDGCLVVQPAFRPEEALDAIVTERVGALYLAPTLFHDLVTEARRRGEPHEVPRLAYAGAAMTETLVTSCCEVFRPEVFVNHYGSTEVYTFTVQGDQRAKPGCAGRPGVHGRLRLVRTGEGAGPDEVVAHGDVGQVAVAMTSAESFTGYWRRPDADERSIRDGWYFPGDLGRLDADGELWVQGRVDDMIITGGENVFPLEVEDVLARHPHVNEVAVVGVADERLGQKVVACVVTDGATLDGATLDAHCRSSGGLAPFKRPRDYRFVDSLPATSSGKILRRELRDALLRGEHD